LRYRSPSLRLLLHYRPYRLPFRVPMRTAHGTWLEREGLLVRLEDEDGAVGWGEAAPMPEFGTESAPEAEAACRALSGPVGDRELAAPAGMPCLEAALRAAQAELEARHLGKTGPGPVRDALPVAALLPAGRGAPAELRRRADADFRTFKWKVGAGDADEELGLFDEICAELPPGAKIRLDANGAWDRRRAERWLDRCAGRPVEFVEQPVARGADDLLMGLARDHPTTVALDESLVGDRDVGRWLALGWNGVFVVKPSLLADLSGSLAILAAAGADVVFSSALETAVGARFALGAAFGWRGAVRALGFGVWPLFSDARLDGPQAAPFLSHADIDRINPETAWNALN